MKKHTKIYINALDYHISDFMPSELSGSKGVDIHHIVNREDRIENLMLLTRPEHLEYGEIKSRMCYLLEKHRLFLITKNVKFDNKWFEKYLRIYDYYT